MKAATIILYILVAILAIVVFMQWRTIQKLIPATPSGGTNTDNSAGSGRFGDIVNAVNEKLQPKEIKVTY